MEGLIKTAEKKVAKNKLLSDTRLLIIPFVVFLISSFLTPITEIKGDLGMHLLTGKIILQTHSVPTTNLFSYTYPNFPFINHHWLSEVIFFAVQSLSGFNGLLFFTIFIVCLAYLLPFTLVKPNIFAVLFPSSLYISILTQRALVRPEIFSYLFLSSILVILYKFRKASTPLIFAVPLIEILWVNSHIYFPLGVFVSFCFLVDAIVRKEHRTDRRKFTMLSIAVCITCLMPLLNPNGIAGALYPLRVFNNYGYNVIENDNIVHLWSAFLFYHKYIILYFVIVVIVLMILLVISITHITFIDVVLIAFFSIFGVFALRNIPMFVFGTLIPAMMITSNVSRRYLKLSNKYVKGGLVVLFIVLMVQAFVFYQGFNFGLGTIKGESSAVDFLESNHVHGPIFNNFDAGNYLEYRLYPNERVFVDARPEAYPLSFFTDVYTPALSDRRIFENLTNKYHFNIIFFAHADQTPQAATFIGFISNDPDWALVYLDDYIAVYVRNAVANKQLVKQYALQKENYKTPHEIAQDFDALVRMAGFFSKAGWSNQEEDAYYQILAVRPDFCPALHNLIIILNSKNDPNTQMYLSEYQQRCTNN